MGKESEHASVRLDRRSVLSAAVFSLMGAICAAIGAPSVVYLLSPYTKGRNREWLDGGDIGDLAQDRPRAVSFFGERMDGWNRQREKMTAWVVKGPGGAVAAFQPSCTHLGCAFHWAAAQHEFICPCHGSRFGADGAVLHGPAPRPLDRYEVRVEGSRLWLRIPGPREADPS